MINKGLTLIVTVFLFNVMTSGCASLKTTEGVSLEKAKVSPTINGAPVNLWNPTERGFYSVTEHAIVHFSFMSKLPEKEAKLIDGMKVLGWHVGYFTLHPDMPEAKVDQLMCFYLGDKEPIWSACFDYRGLGEDKEGVKGPAWVIYYELYELKLFAPIAPSADKILKI